VSALRPAVARALFLTQIPSLRLAAVDWLRGRDVPAEEEDALALAPPDGAPAGGPAPRAPGAAPRITEPLALERVLALGRLFEIHRPVLLCVDQTESLNDRWGTALKALVEAVREILAGPGYLILLTCLEDVWQRTYAPRLEPQALSVLGADPPALAPLRPPTAPEAEEILAARLADVYYGVRPPYPTYPLPPETVRAWLETQPLTPRELLRRAARAVDEIRMGTRPAAAVAAAPAPASAPAAASASPMASGARGQTTAASTSTSTRASPAVAEAFGTAWKRLMNGPPSRAEREDAEGAYFLAGLRLLTLELAGRPGAVATPIARVEDAPADEKVGLVIRVGPPGAPGGGARVAFAVGETRRWQTLAALAAHLSARLRDGTYAAVFVFRDSDMPDGWKVAAENLDRLEADGGKVARLSLRSRRALHVLRDLHAQAAAGDLELAGSAVSPDLALALGVDALLAEPGPLDVVALLHDAL
jgi:hypothetical protein